VTKIASYPGWALDHVELERKRCNIGPKVKLQMARKVCEVCGSIVTMHNTAIGGGATCVSCGAHGSRRSQHWAGNMEAFITPAPENPTKSYEYGNHGTSCNPISDACGNF